MSPPRLFPPLLACALLLVTSDAQAFSRPTHTKITRQALKLHTQCMGESPGAFPDEATLLRGNSLQERPSVVRMFNWHLYDRNDRLFNLLIHRSVDRIHKRRSRVMHRMLRRVEWGFFDRKYKRLARAAGAVAHYVQDMFSPPNVVPLAVRNNDPFEHYLEDKEDKPAFKAPDEARCKALAQRVSTLVGSKCDGRFCEMRRLLEQSADNTWRSLDNPMSSVASLKWRAVWMAQGERDLDGRKCIAGELVERPKKGDEGGIFSRGMGCYGVPFAEQRGAGPRHKDRYAYFEDRFQAAVEASAVVIGFAARKIGGRSEPLAPNPPEPEQEPGDGEGSEGGDDDWDNVTEDDL